MPVVTSDVLVKIKIPQRDPTDDPCSIGFAFHASVGASADMSAIGAAAVALFNTAPPAAVNPLSAYVGRSGDRSANVCSWAVYDIASHLDGSPHGSPIAGGSFTLGASAGVGPVPDGAAAAVSWRADYGADVEFAGPRGEGLGGTRPRARDRNRCYFGPLDALSLGVDPGTGRTKFVPPFTNDIVLAVQAFAGPLGAPGWVLRAWSRKNKSTKPVTLIWFDDRPDYQRRRSDQSTQRVTVAGPGL